ncbi:hypothetical protein NEFER03_1898 [Nematocida sp. LUAm3]|nr:hypothetical protein NEFER03_1898 [Nematocida sp. LUAm3]KAI5173951.1 hypothetical protein NEFER02_0418 [Nematocida sp. LUAm2]KAI5177304.1 hypothetical protein NEFER01_0579 [Nematocida sp. LUAm1]
MFPEKEEAQRMKKTHENPKRKRERGAGKDKGTKHKSNPIKKGMFYKIEHIDGRVGAGRVMETTETGIKLSSFVYEDNAEVLYEYVLRLDELALIEPIHTFSRKEAQKLNIVVVIMISGSTGYGELVDEQPDYVVLSSFTFLNDPAIGYDSITIKKEFIRNLLKLGLTFKEMEADAPKEIATETNKQKDHTHGFVTDKEFKRKREHKDKEFVPFYEGGRAPANNGYILENTSTKGWNQFEVNERKFGFKATYDESIYNTVLDKNSEEYKKHEKEAEEIAKRMMSSSSKNFHLEEERGRISNLSEDEKYGTAVPEEKPGPPKSTRRDRRAPQEKSESSASVDESSTWKESTGRQSNGNRHPRKEEVKHQDRPKERNSSVTRSPEKHKARARDRTPKIKAIPVNLYDVDSSEDFSSKAFNQGGATEKTFKRNGGGIVSVNVTSGPTTSLADIQATNGEVVEEKSSPAPETKESSPKPTKVQEKEEEKPYVRKKVNAQAKSFEPTTAMRNGFFNKSQNKKKDGPIKKEDMESEKWGDGPSIFKGSVRSSR